MVRNEAGIKLKYIRTIGKDVTVKDERVSGYEIGMAGEKRKH